MYINVHVYIYEELFKKTIYELGIGIANRFFGMALIAFWKRSLHVFIQLFTMNICICELHILWTIQVSDLRKIPVPPTGISVIFDG